MSAPIKFNRSPHCTLCAERLVRDRDFSSTSDTRIYVGLVAFCVEHDLAGPADYYSDKSMKAWAAQ